MIYPAAKPLRPDQLVTVNCDLCGSNENATIASKAGVVYDHVFHIVRCSQCGHVFVNPRLSDETIEALYDEEYYQGRGFDRTIDYAEHLEGDALQERFRDEILTLREAAGSLRDVSILDIGCGSGGLVRALRAYGADAAGFDTSASAQRLCKQYATPMVATTLDELYGSNRRYDIVTAVEVIEHTFSPLAFLESISRLVRPGGVLFIGTGNWNLVRLDPGTPYVMPEGHIHYLTPVTLGKYFHKAGLQTTGTFNFMWAGWRRLAAHLGVIGPATARVTAAVIARLSPGVGPFPVARRPEN